MRRHIQVLFKSIGGKFEWPSEKREETIRIMARNRLLAPAIFFFERKLVSCSSYFTVYGFFRGGFNYQIYNKTMIIEYALKN